jgi:hypothetical protein
VLISGPCPRGGPSPRWVLGVGDGGVGSGSASVDVVLVAEDAAGGVVQLLVSGGVGCPVQSEADPPVLVDVGLACSLAALFPVTVVVDPGCVPAPVLGLLAGGAAGSVGGGAANQTRSHGAGGPTGEWGLRQRSTSSPQQPTLPAPLGCVSGERPHQAAAEHCAPGRHPHTGTQAAGKAKSCRPSSGPPMSPAIAVAAIRRLFARERASSKVSFWRLRVSPVRAARSGFTALTSATPER